VDMPELSTAFLRANTLVLEVENRVRREQVNKGRRPLLQCDSDTL